MQHGLNDFMTLLLQLLLTTRLGLPLKNVNQKCIRCIYNSFIGVGTQSSLYLYDSWVCPNLKINMKLWCFCELTAPTLSPCWPRWNSFQNSSALTPVFAQPRGQLVLCFQLHERPCNFDVGRKWFIGSSVFMRFPFNQDKAEGSSTEKGKQSAKWSARWHECLMCPVKHHVCVPRRPWKGSFPCRCSVFCYIWQSLRIFCGFCFKCKSACDRSVLPLKPSSLTPSSGRVWDDTQRVISL